MEFQNEWVVSFPLSLLKLCSLLDTLLFLVLLRIHIRRSIKREAGMSKRNTTTRQTTTTENRWKWLCFSFWLCTAKGKKKERKKKKAENELAFGRLHNCPTPLSYAALILSSFLHIISSSAVFCRCYLVCLFCLLCFPFWYNCIVFTVNNETLFCLKGSKPSERQLHTEKGIEQWKLPHFCIRRQLVSYSNDIP